MKRRDFLVTGAAGAALAGPALAQTSGAPQVQWRLASSFPKSLDTLFGAAEYFCKRVAALTGNRFQIRPYAAGEIVPPLQVLDAVQGGTIECGQTASYYYVGKNPAFAFDTTLPFGLNTRQQNAWMYAGGGLELMRELFREHGAVNFPAGNTGAQMGGWFKREITSLASLRGLKMRIPGMGGQVMNRLGVTVQVLGGTEIYPALERGAIDATEFSMPAIDERLGFDRVVKYNYYPGWHQTFTAFHLVVNQDIWNGLSEQTRALLDLTCTASVTRNLAHGEAIQGDVIRGFEAKGVNVRSLPEDLLRELQTVTEEVLLRLARHARDISGQKNLCLAGGVALNCVANGKILREKIFERIWIQPAAGDAGGALGAALALWHDRPDAGAPGRKPAANDAMRAALLGPEYSNAEIETALRSHQAVYQKLDEESLLLRTVDLLRQERVVGWFQGRMEFGPRALGNRSILGDARSPRMQSVMNLKVKFRESFRPFAPVVRRERAADYFELDVESPYMLLVAPVKKELCRPAPESVRGFERLNQVRSSIPAVTHVDYSARIQTVAREQNPRLYALLERFEEKTGCSVLVNTSFNVRGEPIVCSPDDAYRCFVSTEMDYLVIGNFILDRGAQPRTKVGRILSPRPD